MGQEVGEVRPQIGDRRRRFALNLVIGDHPFVPRHVFAHQGERHVHRRVAGECGFDLAELHPEAADLDLMVEAAEAFIKPIGTQAHAVAGLVDELARATGKGIREVPFGGLPGAAEVTAGNPEAAEEELAQLSRRQQLA